MDILVLILLSAILAASVGSWRNTLKALKAVPASGTVKPVKSGVSSPGHRLVRTWIGRDDETHAVAGWRWKCSCGVFGAAGDASAAKRTLGSEENVIGLFMKHAQGYKDANGNAWKDKHDELQQKFDAFVEKCYCKDTIHHQLERP